MYSRTLPTIVSNYVVSMAKKHSVTSVSREGSVVSEEVSAKEYLSIKNFKTLRNRKFRYAIRGVSARPDGLARLLTFRD